MEKAREKATLNRGKHDQVWSIILAGGDGERLRSLTEVWLGYHKPKQHCVFTGTRSMLQHTLDRANLLTTAERRVTIVGRSHLGDACSELSTGNTGKLVLQPANRDTAAGVFLGLARPDSKGCRPQVCFFPVWRTANPTSEPNTVAKRTV